MTALTALTYYPAIPPILTQPWPFQLLSWHVGLNSHILAGLEIISWLLTHKSMTEFSFSIMYSDIYAANIYIIYNEVLDSTDIDCCSWKFPTWADWSKFGRRHLWIRYMLQNHQLLPYRVFSDAVARNRVSLPALYQSLFAKRRIPAVIAI